MNVVAVLSLIVAIGSLWRSVRDRATLKEIARTVRRAAEAEDLREKRRIEEHRKVNEFFRPASTGLPGSFVRRDYIKNVEGLLGDWATKKDETYKRLMKSLVEEMEGDS